MKTIHQHPMTPCLPGDQPLLDLLIDFLVCCDVTGWLQDQRLKNDEPLQVPLYVLYPVKLFRQGHHEASPDLPAWRVVATDGREKKKPRQQL